MKLTNYEKALNYIHNLPRLHETNNLKFVRQALEYLDNPQDQIATVHVTGTNGKGTTCYYLTQFLINNGDKVATFTSPYVEQFTERFQIDEIPVSPETIVDLTRQVDQVVKQIKKQDSEFYLVEFEFLVVMMFLLCVQEQVDWGIIEAGIGGQHDKTNVIHPKLSIITNVGLDHMKLIGPTLEDIAREKAGVIKQDVPILLGDITPDVLSIFLETAKQKQAPVFKFRDDFTISNVKMRESKTTFFTWQDPNYLWKNLQLNTISKTQLQDVALAIKAYVTLVSHPDVNDIQRGLRVYGLPARMQFLSEEPLIILDGAHNLPAITQLLADIQPLKQSKRLIVLYAAMQDKQRDAILTSISKVATQIFVTQLTEQRSAKEMDYQLPKQAIFVPSWRLAFGQAVNSLDNDSLLLICGSLHFAGDILRLLKEN
ncbi:bifunctional folylpolyglutamate synthase/dihydrofolate synthase [Bombilactobacillus folatiphilus]|uniref:tetrahydrofolate synthase n=1 Tax=Bombilactobacillus folatiphilus TaxID=2923362 RepID=A0ABY4PAN9_9LACO|nr:folylpolyglutamate synthase/dihydrofolate synthase family protein [Bombilactobacillus folatiphilus]UQS82690.1 bifunctional folylpolyglutamate synthase/dihydrofolate synthase [Bombilactobacillus folatiphilus]